MTELKEPDFYLCFDIRSTILENDAKESDKPEIIEITVIPIDAIDCKIIDEHFHCIVQPTNNPILSEKCKEQTKIKQYRIDEAKKWPQVLESLEEWLKTKKYTSENCKIIADGSYEYEKNLLAQSAASGTKIPHLMKEWINIRKDFKEGTGVTESLDELNIYVMLDRAGIPFEGTKMNGHDEGFHLALLAVNILRHDYKFQNFEQIKHN